MRPLIILFATIALSVIAATFMYPKNRMVAWFLYALAALLAIFVALALTTTI